MSIFQAILLAIVEGLTEFLPVSSTGHLIITASALGIANLAFTKVFIIAVQLGAILSVGVLYWKRFFQTFDFYFKLLVAFIPAVILGLLLNDYIDALLERVDVVGYMLILGGVVFLFVDQYFNKTSEAGKTDLNYSVALKIGFFQTIAMLPGVSRSAATIIGGLTQGLTKKAAAEFSFFLAMPTLFAATVYKLYKFNNAGLSFSNHELTLLVIGNVVSFMVGLLAIKAFISFLTKNGFKLFGYYRIVAGLTILVLYYFGYNLLIV